ncbi:MAG: peroxiredoxin [Alphaproteobacteria bacterium]
MPIKVGDKIPSMKLNKLGPDGMTQVSTDDIFKGKTVVMFGLPGAFTPVCSARHVPGYLEKMKELKDKGVDSVVCLSVNDPFVMKAWGEDQKVGDNIVMLPDGNAQLTKALGLDYDGSGFGLGTRSKRYALVAKDGVVKHLAVEAATGELDVSSAESILKKL